MTDVVTHAAPSPGDGHRRADGPRGRRARRAHRGLRAPEVAAATPGPDEGSGARHRRTPITSSFAVPTVTEPGPSRHRAADTDEAFDLATGPILTEELAAPSWEMGEPTRTADALSTSGTLVPDDATAMIATAEEPAEVADGTAEEADEADTAMGAVTAATAVTGGTGETGTHALFGPDAAPTAFVSPTAPATSTGTGATLATAATVGPGTFGAADPTTTVRTGRTFGARGTTGRTFGSRSTTAGPVGAGSTVGGPVGSTVSTGTPGTTPSPRRKAVVLRTTIGLIGAASVAALFALTSPGSPLPTSAPIDPLPAAAAPVGLDSPALPPPGVGPAPIPVVPVAPPAAPAPSVPAVQPVVGALFDAASGSLPRLFDNSGGSGLVEGGVLPQIVANPDAPGRQAWQFSLPGGGMRSEVLPQGPGTEPVDGEEQYVRYTARLSDDFPTNTDSWQVILQWHHTSASGSPPLALQVTRGQLVMVSDGVDMQSIGAVRPGDKIDLTMHIKFSQTPGAGAVTVWRNGQPTGVTNWTPARGTMSTAAAYLKMGLYRDPGIGQPGSVLVSDLKIGRTPEGIGGLGPRPPAG